MMDMIEVRRVLDSVTVKGRHDPVRLIGPNCPGIVTPGGARLESCLDRFTDRGMWAWSPGQGRSPTRPLASLRLLESANRRASGLEAIPSAGWTSWTCSTSFKEIPIRVPWCLSARLVAGPRSEPHASSATRWTSRWSRSWPVRRRHPASAWGTLEPSSRREGTAIEKIAVLEEAGVHMAPTPAEMASTLARYL